MKSLALIVLLFAVVKGHSTLTSVRINGQARTDCLRPVYPDFDPQTQLGNQWPISSSSLLSDGINSNNYTCGFMPYGGTAASTKCTVAAGSQVGVSWYHGAASGEDPVKDKYIHNSHRGPFLAYLAKTSGAITGNIWFKIYQTGKLQEATTWENVKWASPDTLLANNGFFDFTIPSDIAPGDYVLRAEIIALHDVNPRGAQPYVRCIDLTITGTGKATPAGVAIPGAYTYGEPGLVYNVYNDFRNPYPFPGPAVYVPGTSSTGASGTTTRTPGSSSTTRASSTTRTASNGSSTGAATVPSGASTSAATTPEEASSSSVLTINFLLLALFGYILQL